MLKGKLTTDEIKAHLTLEEIERIGQDRPQMTHATTQFIESLVEERIQKAALLAACKAALKVLENPRGYICSDATANIVKSAIEQAGEV